MRTCEYLICEEDYYGSCGKPACMHINFPSGTLLWVCAEHYDAVIEFWRMRARNPVYEEKYGRTLRLNKEPIHAAR
jgi:hypothetical protein